MCVLHACTCSCVCVCSFEGLESRGGGWISFLSLSLYSLETRSFTETRALPISTPHISKAISTYSLLSILCGCWGFELMSSAYVSASTH